jgi:tRNA uridine 5-carboxymethylaminomethyl modification enzyme
MYHYKTWMRETLEAQEGLHIKQGMVEGFITEKSSKNKRVAGVHTQSGQEFMSRAVVIASGTFLNGLIHVGMTRYPAGRAGEFPSVSLSRALTDVGLELGRLKTGTTPRLDAKTIDFGKTAAQYGDIDPKPFSFKTDSIDREQIPCWITHTNEMTHEAIRSGLEPEGLQTREYYPNGVSTSLPVDIQLKMLRTIPGLEEVQIMRPGYAIEYDFVYPSQLGLDLQVKAIEGLFLAGQINGTSGYEEAAAQGILAGINAGLMVKGEPALTIGRDEAYLGVLVDDLVTKGVTEPYRLFTSRAEHRLLLREDNADLRLMERGHQVGLIGGEEIERLREKVRLIADGLKDLESRKVSTSLSGGPKQGISLLRALRQPKIRYDDLINYNEKFVPASRAEVAEQIEIKVKYEGYIKRQQAMVEKMRKLESLIIPEDLDYTALQTLSREVRGRLEEVRPRSLGQASRIPGVTPAAVSALMVYLKSKEFRDQALGTRDQRSD